MESVFRQVRGPILTVGPMAAKLPLVSVRRVLSPIDLSPTAQEHFQYSVDLAERAGAEVVAVHILERPDEGSSQEALKNLCEWISPEARANCTVREIVKQGKPAEAIIAEAKASRADIIVLGARPQSYFGGLVFGSTTEAVIRAAPCPVLSIIQRANRDA
jgi:nucleotide-binding universal stress UspA family protein